MHAKKPYEAKYQLLINKSEVFHLKRNSDSKAFIEYSNDMDDIYENIEECSLNKKCKVLTIFFLVNDTSIASDNPLRFR